MLSKAAGKRCEWGASKLRVLRRSMASLWSRMSRDARRATQLNLELGTASTLIHTMSLATTTTAIIRQSSRLARTALCRRQLVAHFASPTSCPGLQFDKLPQRRMFVSTRPRRAAPAPTPTATPAVLRRSPTAEDIENAELDMEPLPQTDARLALTERAAEVRRYSTPTY